MKLNISLLTILTAVLVTPTFSLADDRDHKDRNIHGRDTYTQYAYSKNFRGISFHHGARHLDRAGNRIDRRLDRKGEHINHKLDQAAHRAWLRGDYRQARRLDQKGNRIERYFDRKGDKINRKLNHRAYRTDYYSSQQHAQNYRHHKDRNDRDYDRIRDANYHRGQKHHS